MREGQEGQQKMTLHGWAEASGGPEDGVLRD